MIIRRPNRAAGMLQNAAGGKTAINRNTLPVSAQVAALEKPGSRGLFVSGAALPVDGDSVAG